jgi:transcriptional regulator with XRE-family HTH domain
MSILERLKQLRKYKNMNQTEFAGCLNMAQNSYSAIENGKHTFTEKNIALICLTFNVREEWLRYGIGEMFNNVSFDDFSPDKREFLDIYSQLYPKNQEIVLKYANMLLKDQIEEQQALMGKEALPEKGGKPAGLADDDFPLEPIRPDSDPSDFIEKKRIG